MRKLKLPAATLSALVALGACSASETSPNDALGGGSAETDSGGSTASGGRDGNPPGGLGGGPIGSGGRSSSGGSTNTACTNVRPTGTEWDEATCDQWASETTECNNAWMIDNDYCNQSCGRCSSSGSGGSVGTGGGGAVVGSCTESEKTVCDNESGTHCGYTYEYWKDQGTGCMVNKADGFSVEWNNINNLLGRKGLRPGSRNQVVTYEADYRPNGNSYLCIYGWTRNPLVEYYIVDSWGDWRPPGGEGHMGTVTSDGGTYDLYRVQRTGPSIDGDNTTFYQYWSVRTDKRTNGTITVSNHFGAWESAGMNMGSLYEVSMCVEGYQSSGTADVRVSMD